MADHYTELQKMGVEVYSVSTDTHFTHKAWHDASDTIHKIQYPMIGDPTGAITRNFGVMIEEEGLALRGTFVINPEGEIKIAEVHDLGSAAVHQSFLRKIKQLSMLLSMMVKFASSMAARCRYTSSIARLRENLTFIV
eukprot:TRINITY_DN11083_c0_g1_i1.p1 TRINITY_DN11083_c0_g1~~TRINITY_DN11083_c0_g1_i1.p1  ORF type:complete len:147 (+),score=0.13 TRINITY_DN11083_c0_g1_i1:29-442(+)